MAIINLTPDSFYDGGRYGNVKDVLLDAEQKINSGASILDLGAASSRPGAPEITEEEEWKRLEPVLSAIRNQFPATFISIDTYRSDIALKAASAGADIINDISGGNFDKNMFAVIAKLQLPYILMHIQGTPQNMQKDPTYSNVVAEVMEAFQQKTEELKLLGFHKIILDPGFGFGKNTDHNFQLLKHIGVFVEAGYPMLAGISRKSMINKVIKTNPVTSLNGTTVLNTIALLNGASVLRVHDVTEAMQAIDLVEYYKKA
ncbi:MAG: dihydropteroate synthase [Bacteroidetes bacterium]|nr:dihydropteroate synthase [Bacteroidota bacterium]